MEQREQGHERRIELDADAAAETLRLASRLQEEAKSRFSLEDLNRIASEAGIEPRFVEQALQSQEAAQTRKRTPEVVPMQPSTLWLALVGLGFVLANSVINHGPAGHVDRGWMYTLVAWGMALASGILAARLWPSRIPRFWLPTALAVIAFALRARSNYGWNLSWYPDTTLAVIILAACALAGAFIGFTPSRARHRSARVAGDSG